MVSGPAGTSAVSGMTLGLILMVKFMVIELELEATAYPPERWRIDTVIEREIAPGFSGASVA